MKSGAEMVFRNSGSMVVGFWKNTLKKKNTTKGTIDKDQKQSILTMLKPKGYRGGHSIVKRKSKDIVLF